MKRHAYALNRPVLICFSLFLALTATAQAANLTIDSRQQFDFAQHLFDSGQFRRAAEEFERFAFFFPDDPKKRSALLKAGHSFFQAGDATAAIRIFNVLTDTATLDATAIDAFFLMAECYLMLHSFDHAVLQLRNLILLSDDIDTKDSAYLRIAWIHIERMDWPSAKHALKKISPTGRRRHRIDALETDLAKIDAVPHKSPALAGTLSIVPGAGQLYCGRYEDALAAFLVNGGLAWAAYDSFDNGLNGLGGMITLVGLGFYMGNIYGAVTDAHKYNRRQNEGFIEQVKQHMTIGIGSIPADHGREPVGALTLAFHFNF